VQGSISSGPWLGGSAKLVALVGAGPSAKLETTDGAAKALKVRLPFICKVIILV
jgi:hypothetical protein